MKRFSKIIVVFSTTLLSAFLFAIFTTEVFAQCSRAYCEANYGQGWDCWLSCQASNQCCHCRCGDLPDYSDNGPLDCITAGCSNLNAWGCKPCGGGPTSPPSTPKPTNTPTPIPLWYCLRPYASSNKCDNTLNIQCTNPDLPGGLCYTTKDACESGCAPVPTEAITPRPSLKVLCTYAPGRFGINTAIGCFPVDSTNSANIFIIRWALGVASGIVFLLIIYSAFLIMGSGGNTEKVKAGRELMTAALAGLFLIIFSVFILDIFGLRIFKIPGIT